MKSHLYFIQTNIWVSMRENIPSDISLQWRLKSACPSTQFDQCLHCLHEETLHPWLFQMHPVKILMRLHKCAGWSESLLGAHTWRYVFWHSRSFDAATTWITLAGKMAISSSTLLIMRLNTILVRTAKMALLYSCLKWEKTNKQTNKQTHTPQPLYNTISGNQRKKMFAWPLSCWKN